MPAQAGPVPVRGPAHPLALGRDARARLGGAVRALLDAPGLDGMTDAVRLAVIVLASRTPYESGVVEIRTPELARWLGLSASYVASEVVSGLRRSGVVCVETAEGESGQDIGLKCKVLPMWAAHGVVGHPLALAKQELATLLRLLEAVMAPGWAHRDGRVTPAGLLGPRTGRAAATDRLALLLLVLEARETGRVRQCGGTVDTRRGRAAATVARLLGCTASAGERVLERLEDQDLVVRVRVRTASGLRHRSRLVVPAVAAAHGRDGIADAREDRLEAVEPAFSDPALAAGGSGTSEPEADLQVGEMPVPGEADVADPALTAALHADHPPVAVPVLSAALSGGCSGEGRGADGRRPEGACAREDQAVDGEVDVRPSPDRGAGDPLRGEQRQESESMSSKNAGCGPVAGKPVRVVAGAGQGRQQGGRTALPAEDLRVVLAPVSLVWGRLERPAARRLVEAAARSELATLSGFVGRDDAPQVLADRVARRLSEQLLRGGPVKDPVGWLISKALPQRQECGDALCDDRMLLDSGGDCPRCEDRQANSLARRRAVAAAVDDAMPYATAEERRAAVDRQLHEDVTAQAWAREYRWEQVRARQAAAAKARAAAAAAHPSLEELAGSQAPAVLPTPRPAPAVPAPRDVAVDQELVLEDLTREQVLDWRTRAAHDHQVVFDHIDRYGETSAQRLFTREFVATVQRLSRLGHLNLGYTPWGSA
ncbi:hypothetical protein AB0D59_47385 [Streptomyces sp. NPDC048417]|uniref:hypothetical protein n=1 Tax=Streptomyces sp. NPDC048417 TaxID=3155387 RepID=UPI003424BE5D